ncbi:MAG: prolipoprotein diacylglyceryl transferase [Solobacterium sp.]|nr:prolipoprotein diacylglyceryl transferase [Solobacterium sp.]
MYNDWLKIGSFTIHGYGVMIGIGILAAFFVGERLAKKHGLSSDELDNLIFVCLITGFLGSKLTYILTNFRDFLTRPAAYLSPDGWVVWGGIIGGLLGGYAWCRFRKLDFMAYCNLSVIIVALAQGFGRIGCFFAGCCYGKETTGPGIVFPEGSLAPAGVRLIPTQLISSFGDFVLFYVLYKMYEDPKTENKTAAAYLILYSIGRFVIEFFRGDEARGFIMGLSTSQFISIIMFVIGVIILVKYSRAKANTEGEN